MECTVCQMVLGSAGPCPVCGSEVPATPASQTIEMRESNLEDIESKESLNLPFGLSIQGSNDEVVELPFGVGDTPNSLSPIPFGIGDAPSTPDSLNSLPFGLEDAPVAPDASKASRAHPGAFGQPHAPSGVSEAPTPTDELSTPTDEPSTTLGGAESDADSTRETAQADSANFLPSPPNSPIESAEQPGGISASTNDPEQAGNNREDSAGKPTHTKAGEITQIEQNSLSEKGRIGPSKLPYGIDHMHHTMID